MLNHSDIMSTVDMIDHQHLDIRTITMGISLLDCADPDPAACARKIHDKICRQAEHLVATGCQIERELGIPIVNKRISVTPIALVASACETEDFVPFARAMDQAAKTCGVDFIGGFSALVHKGMASGDRRLIAAIPQALAETELVCSSVNVASTKAGINMDAVRLMGQAIKKTAELTKERDGLGCAKLVVFCNAVEDNPFMAGAFHGVGEADAVVSVGVSGPGVVYHALQSVKSRPFDEVAECVKKTAFRITRMGQLVAREASRRLGVPFGVVDLSLAPTPAVGDSVARILEEMGLAVCGTHGTTAALAMLDSDSDSEGPEEAKTGTASITSLLRASYVPIRMNHPAASSVYSSGAAPARSSIFEYPQYADYKKIDEEEPPTVTGEMNVLTVEEKKKIQDLKNDELAVYSYEVLRVVARGWTDSVEDAVPEGCGPAA